MTTIKEKQMATKLKVAPINGGTAVPNVPTPVVTPKVAAPKVTPAVITPIKEEIKIEPTSSVAEKVQENISNTDITKLTYDEVKAIALKAIAKVNAIKDELKNMFYERDEVIEDLMRCLISGQHLLMLGPPGTGKSALAEEMTSRIVSARIFKWLLNRTSDPSEVIGPVSIKSMERDKFKRILDGKLADCEIAFLDEIFKSNEPTLNAMLPILNERIVYNDGKAVDVPLRMLVAASNEIPEEDEGLEALYDRILVKHWVDYIKDPANREKMMKDYNERKNPYSNKNSKTKTYVTLEEIDVLQHFKNSITVPGTVSTAFGKLLNNLDRQGIKFSDRKINWCWDVMKATALMDGRTAVDFDDLSAVNYILWEDRKDIDFIRQETAKLINPFNEKIMKWYAESMEQMDYVSKLHATDKKKATSEILEIKSKIEIILGKMDKTINEAKSAGRDAEKMSGQRNKISTKLQELVYTVLGINPTSPLDQATELPF